VNMFPLTQQNPRSGCRETGSFWLSCVRSLPEARERARTDIARQISGIRSTLCIGIPPILHLIGHPVLEQPGTASSIKWPMSYYSVLNTHQDFFPMNGGLPGQRKMMLHALAGKFPVTSESLDFPDIRFPGSKFQTKNLFRQII
jgi:hypothetical protein